MSQSDHLTEAELRRRLAEAEAALAALRSGKADTLIGDAGPLLFQLKSAVEEKERLQRETARSAREWAATFDSVQDAIWILDADQRVVRANAAAEKAFDCPLAEMIGRRCFETAHHTDRPIDGCPFCRMRVSRQREEFEMQVGGRWFRVTADLLLGEDGSLIGAVHIARDITERKRAEEALRREHTLLERITSASPAGITVVDRHGQITFANPQAEKILGLTKEAITQRTYNDVAWHITDLNGRPFPDEELPFRRVVTTRQPVTDIRHAIELPDGRRVVLSINGAPLLDASGELEGAVLTVSDITEQLQTEAALRESEARFRRLFENSLVGIYRTTPDGRILLANPTLVKMLRYPSFEALAQVNLEKDGFHPQYPRRLFKEAIERDGTVRGLESAWTCADGTTVYVRESAQAVRGPDGRIEYYEGVAEDITEQRRLEEQLRQAQKLEAIGQLAGGVAHDFNNILAAIIMQTELPAMDEGLPDAAREGLRQIRVAAERAASLTRQLLLFSRRQVMQPRDLDLNEIVVNLAKMLQRIIGEDVRLELGLHSRLLMTRADAGMLDQVLLNLAVNARDAMPEGGRLTIETTTREFTAEETAALPDVKPGRYVSLRVTDTGSGIAPDILPRIFEPFFTTKEPGKGTGLGLATVFGIVKQHGGCIQVASQVGRGTTFEVHLPALLETATADAGQAKSRPAPRGGTETILLVEDDPSVRLLTRMTLQRHGYRVLEATDGMTALELWQRHRDAVALLLTDLVMPGGLNGRALARRLRADQPQLKVLYTSGYSAELAGRELENAPGEAFLQKPCPATLLLETVRRCLDTPLDTPPA